MYINKVTNYESNTKKNTMVEQKYVKGENGIKKNRIK